MRLKTFRFFGCSKIKASCLITIQLELLLPNLSVAYESTYIPKPFVCVFFLEKLFSLQNYYFLILILRDEKLRFLKDLPSTDPEKWLMIELLKVLKWMSGCMELVPAAALNFHQVIFLQVSAEFRVSSTLLANALRLTSTCFPTLFLSSRATWFRFPRKARISVLSYPSLTLLLKDDLRGHKVGRTTLAISWAKKSLSAK